jgi:hypothetical protein
VRHFNRRVSFFEQRDCPLPPPLQLPSASLWAYPHPLKKPV